MKRLFLIFLLLIIAIPCFGGQTLKRHLEPETVNYCSLSGASCTDQFTFNEQIKLIKYNGGSVTLSGLTAQFSNATGFQFVTNPSVDLRKWIGYYITFTSSVGNTLKVKVSAGGTGETLSGELIMGWTNNASAPYDTLTVGANGHDIDVVISDGNAIAQAYHTNISMVEGRLYKIVSDITLNSGTAPVLATRRGSGATKNSDIVGPLIDSIIYWTSSKTISTADTGLLIGQSTSVNASLLISQKQVLIPSATGIYFTDPTITGTFNYNAASYTAVITKD